MNIPQEAVEAAVQAMDGASLCGCTDCQRATALNILAAALPHIEKEIRAQVAADIWEYWDACGDLIYGRDSALRAIDAIAARIAEGSDHD